MGLIEDAPNPIEYIKDVRDETQARQQKQLFFEEQFKVMVENGNVEKAVQLIHDEARNLDARLNKDISPEDLAQYCLEKCEETEELKNSENATDELKDKYDISVEDS